MERFIFTSHFDLCEPNIAMYLVKLVAGLFGETAIAPVLITNAKLEAANKQLYAIERSSTWFVTIYSAYTFELTRNEGDGGLEELSAWLAYRYFDLLSRV